MKEVKEIIIGFENCEYMTVDVKDVGCFSITKVKEISRRVAINSISTYKITRKVILELLNSANKNANTTSLFDRIELANDITSIDLIYEDGEIEDYYVYWGSDDISNNNAQDSFINKDGNLCIVISKKISKGKKTAKDYFKE